MSHNGSRMSNAQVAHPWQASLSREEEGGLATRLPPGREAYALKMLESSPNERTGGLIGALCSASGQL